jgi:BMFP domain-containing protein YqiC
MVKAKINTKGNLMFSPKDAQDMAKQFVDSLPPGLKSINQQFEDHLRQFLQSWFSKMSLVTREEFDIQAQVLAKTRQKLEKLEAKLEVLEALLPPENPPS